MNAASSSFLLEGDEPNVQPEVARMFQQIGLQFVRASVVRIKSMEFQAAWSISEHGDVSDGTGEHPNDSLFPGAATVVGGLAGAAPEHTRVQRLSPRRWAFTWRVSAEDAILAEAHYRDKRDSINDIDTALVRLVCSTSARRGAALAGAAVVASEAQVWPHVDRRARARPSALTWLTPALPALAALSCAWLLLVALPAAQSAAAGQQTQNEQLRQTTEDTVVTALANVPTGDYGLAQEELSRFAKMGHFQSALVVNTKGRVVAMAGPLESLRIGDTVPAPYAAQARTRKLVQGSHNLGELLVVAAPATQAVPLTGARFTAALALLACALAAVLPLGRMLRRRVG